METNSLRKLELKARVKDLRDTMFARSGEPGVHAVLEYARIRRAGLYGELREMKHEDFPAWQGQFKAWDDLIAAITTQAAPNIAAALKEQTDGR